MKRVFVDTGAWIALVDKNDDFHPQALRIAAFLKSSNTPLTTSDYVPDETVTWLRYNVGHSIAADFALQLLSSNVTEIFYVDEPVFNKSVQLFKKFSDQKFSFTDSSSFVLMHGHRIKQAFTFDAHFITAGFEILK